jgi:hypothetical protein
MQMSAVPHLSINDLLSNAYNSCPEFIWPATSINRATLQNITIVIVGHIGGDGEHTSMLGTNDDGYPLSFPGLRWEHCKGTAFVPFEVARTGCQNRVFLCMFYAFPEIRNLVLSRCHYRFTGHRSSGRLLEKSTSLYYILRIF